MSPRMIIIVTSRGFYATKGKPPFGNVNALTDGMNASRSADREEQSWKPADNRAVAGWRHRHQPKKFSNRRLYTTGNNNPYPSCYDFAVQFIQHIITDLRVCGKITIIANVDHEEAG